jgi:hypothetical protein
MATGHAYDSDGGRAIAAAITSVMTGTAYRRSAELARVVGPYDGYSRNEAAHKRVMAKHAEASARSRPGGMDEIILAAANHAWQDTSPSANARLPQRRPRCSPHRHHRPHDGLRHHRRGPTCPVKFKSWSAAAPCRSSTRRCPGP